MRADIMMIVSILSISLVSAICPVPLPEGMIICDDFELDGWNYANNWNFGVNQKYNWVRTDEERRPGSDGTHSIRGDTFRYIGASDSCYLGTTLGKNSQNDFEFYIVGWVKFQEGWERPCAASATNCDAPGGTAFSNALRVQDIDGATAPVSGLEADFTHSPTSFLVQRYGQELDGHSMYNTIPFTYGEWHKVGVSIGHYAENGWFRMWIDEDNPTIDNADINLPHNYPKALSHFRFFYYAKRLPYNGTDNSRYWLDDVEVWDRLPGSSCGDGSCETGETCTSCPGDCLESGEVCCGGTAFTGDCCTSSDCAVGTCDNHQCVVCIPSCRECGPDGCGGDCGLCPSQYSCESGLCCHKSDDDKDGCVEDNELIGFIGRWKASSIDATMMELLEAIKGWKEGC